MLFFSSWLWDFIFVCSLIMFLGMSLGCLSCLWFAEIFQPCRFYVFYQIWEVLVINFFKNFYFLHFTLSTSGILMTQMLGLLMLSHTFLRLIYFCPKSLFFLWFRLENFFQSVFTLTGSFLYHLHSAIEPMNEF